MDDQEFTKLNPYNLKGQEKQDAMKRLSELVERADGNLTKLQRYTAYDWMEKECFRRMKQLKAVKDSFQEKRIQMQRDAIEEFKNIQVIKFYTKFETQLKENKMTPQMASELEKINMKAERSCYRFTSDGISVYQLECQTCNSNCRLAKKGSDYGHTTIASTDRISGTVTGGNSETGESETRTSGEAESSGTDSSGEGIKAQTGTCIKVSDSR